MAPIADGQRDRLVLRKLLGGLAGDLAARAKPGSGFTIETSTDSQFIKISRLPLQFLSEVVRTIAEHVAKRANITLAAPTVWFSQFMPKTAAHAEGRGRAPRQLFRDLENFAGALAGAGDPWLRFPGGAWKVRLGTEGGKEKTRTLWIGLKDEADTVWLAPDPKPTSKVPANATEFPHAPHARRLKTPAIAVPQQVPPANPKFYGREVEVRTLRTALQPGPHGKTVILTGAPGTGKTQLASVVAERMKDVFPDGQFFFEFPSGAFLGSGLETIYLGVLRELLPDRATSVPLDPSDLRTQYNDLLVRKRVLLVLDNLPLGFPLDKLLPRAGSAVLATAQAAISGGETVPIGEFAEGAAFLRRRCDKTIAQVTKDHARFLDAADEPDYAALLSRLVGNLPIALRAVMETLNLTVDVEVSDYATRLIAEDERLSMLKAPDGLHSPEAAFSLAYELLSESLRSAFRKLRVLEAAFSAEAAVAVLQSTDARRDLSALQLRSWVDFDEVHRLYRLHDLLRLFAQQQARLTPDGDYCELLSRVAKHYLPLVEEKASDWQARDRVLFERWRSESSTVAGVIGRLFRNECQIAPDLLLRYSIAIAQVLPVLHPISQRDLPAYQAAIQLCIEHKADARIAERLGLIYLAAIDSANALSGGGDAHLRQVAEAAIWFDRNRRQSDASMAESTLIWLCSSRDEVAPLIKMLTPVLDSEAYPFREGKEALTELHILRGDLVAAYRVLAAIAESSGEDERELLANLRHPRSLMLFAQLSAAKGEAELVIEATGIALHRLGQGQFYADEPSFARAPVINNVRWVILSLRARALIALKREDDARALLEAIRDEKTFWGFSASDVARALWELGDSEAAAPFIEYVLGTNAEGYRWLSRKAVAHEVRSTILGNRQGAHDRRSAAALWRRMGIPPASWLTCGIGPVQ